MLIYVLFTAIWLVQCSPAKRIKQQQQDYRELINDYLNNNPVKYDSSIEVKQGKTDSVPVIIVFDTLAFLKAKDSLTRALKKKYTLDTADCTRQVNEAFETGARWAADKFKNKKIPAARVDTFFKVRWNTQEINRLSIENNQLKGQLMECRKAKNYLLHFIVSLSINMLLAIVLIKKIFKK